MKTITFKPEFEAKLKKLKVKRRFVRNMIAYCEDYHYDLENKIKIANRIGCFNRFIANAFFWEHTPEGYKFWENISES